MILYIDTSNKDKVVVKLDISGKIYQIKGSSKRLKAQQALLLIDNLLKKHKKEPKELKKIKIKRGPGSFTGLRVGIAIANTIGWILNIPVNDKKFGDIEVPKYS